MEYFEINLQKDIVIYKNELNGTTIREFSIKIPKGFNTGTLCQLVVKLYDAKGVFLYETSSNSITIATSTVRLDEETKAKRKYKKSAQPVFPVDDSLNPQVLARICPLASHQISTREMRRDGEGKTYLLLNGDLLSSYETTKFDIEFHLKKVSLMNEIPGNDWTPDNLDSLFNTNVF